MGKVVKGKAVQFIVLTLTFTVIFIFFANKGLSSAANVNNDSFYTYNRTLDSSAAMILMIPAIIVSLLVMTVLQKANGRIIAFPIAQKIGYSKFIETGGISSRRIGIFTSSMWRTLVWIYKAVKKALWAILVAVVGVFSIFSWITGGSSKSSGGSSGGGVDYSGGDSSSSSNPGESKSEAIFKANNKLKDARHAQNQTDKQRRHNENTHHYTESLNRTNAKVHAANKEAKRVRNL